MVNEIPGNSKSDRSGIQYSFNSFPLFTKRCPIHIYHSVVQGEKKSKNVKQFVYIGLFILFKILFNYFKCFLPNISNQKHTEQWQMKRIFNIRKSISMISMSIGEFFGLLFCGWILVDFLLIQWLLGT
jgi:hypothetical protein